MKVVQKGRPQAGWAEEFSCTGGGNGMGGCGAVLLVEEGDLFRTQSSARDEITQYTTFRCPECGVNTDIRGVPSNVESRLPAGVKHPENGWMRPVAHLVDGGWG